VGGQAVLEGVMMRSPRSFVVVCRRPDGSIVLKESPWRSVWERVRFLRWPLLRGGVVFWEALTNGLSALSFAAEQQVEAEQEGDGAEAEDGGGSSKAAITGTIVLAMALAFLLFGALPHLLAWGVGWLTGVDLGEGKSLAFHAIDGGIKLLIFLGYLWGISRMKEIRRVFAYHGAEHKAIYTFERGEELTVANARRHTTFHPRCGTSFLILVLMVSIGVFTAVFSGPWMPVFFPDHRVLNQAAYILVKLPLMFPIAGLSYEVLRLSGKRPDSPWLRPIVAPGLWLQRITTREPTDEMLEVALLSLRKVLWRESQGSAAGANGGAAARDDAQPEVFASADEVTDLPLRWPLEPTATPAGGASCSQADAAPLVLSAL